MNSLRLARGLYSSGIFILCFVFFMSLFFFLYYVHETGHIVFGFADGLVKGKITTFTISSWVNYPFFHFLKLPQQTKIVNGLPSLNFVMGGPIFTILVFLGLSLFAYLRSKNSLWFLLFFSIALFEISGNVICGTDNFTGSPLSVCNHGLDLTLQCISIAVFSGTFSYFATRKLVLWKPLKARRI